jgi:hypothetical protein
VPSPFPGMNPYLEQEDVWQDFHQSFIPLIREALSEQVRPGYFVMIEEHLFIHELPAEERRLVGRADVGVTSSGQASSSLPGTQVIEAPAYGQLALTVDVERHSYLEIRDRRHRDLVAVIELLSPSNKRLGVDRDQYLAKRQKFLLSGAHLVEMDLLRGGPRLPVEGLPDCDYYVLVSRVQDRPAVALWPIQLRERLPKVPIPLRADDGPAWLDLQPLLHRLYDAAGYEDHIYTGSPQPPLSARDNEWVGQLLPARSQD